MARARTALVSRGWRRLLGAGGSLRFLPLVLVVVTLCLLVTLSPCHRVTLSPCRGQESEGVPVFRRLLLSAERLPEELKRVDDGVLVRVPLADFDALAERAARAGVRKVPPRFLEARYHATLKDEALIGEGQWKLVHKGPGPGLLNLEPFNLALRQARFENGEALIAAFDGKTPALLVETPGEQTVSLDWSARAESSPDGLQFHLETPACPVALLELDVPTGRGVTVLNDGALLSGPHEAETAELRRWKIVCGGRRFLDIRVLPAERTTPGTETTPFVRQKTTQKLHPEGLDAAFELTLDGLARGVRELVCECDPELRLREVVGPGVDSCSWHNGGADKPARLIIRLREPMRAGTWLILCLAPLNRSSAPGGPQPIAWRSPGLRLLNAVSRGETLTLWLHPDLRVENWDAGPFRLSSAEVDRASESQVLTLSGGGLGPPRRPTARLHVHGVEFRAHQLAWWRCDAAGMALTVQIGWDVSQGQLFQLPVSLPRDWNVEKVEMNPASLLRDWRVGNHEGKATLFVDLAAPLGPRASGDGERGAETVARPSTAPRTRLPLVTVQLRPNWSGPITTKNLPFPDAVPLGARFREGALALDCDEQLFHLDVRTTAERTEPDSEGPWGTQLPEYYYRYRGQKVEGELRIRARPPRLRARCDSEIFVVSGRAALETRLQLEAEVGSPNTIDLSLSAGDGGPWEWQPEAAPRGDESAVNRVRRAERRYGVETSSAAHLLGAGSPLQAAVLLAARPSGERWRLTLARPLRAREPLRLHARRHLQPRDHRWEVPLPVVLGADRMEGEVLLHLAGADLVHVHTLGLREAAPAADKGAAPWRTFRYGQSEVGLTLSGEALARDRASVAAIDRAHLVTYAGDDGVLRHHFSFQVANWSEHTLPLRLPPDARPLAVLIDGRWLPRLLPAALKEGNRVSAGEPLELALPAPVRADGVPGDSVHHFEVVYTRSLPAGTLWQSLDAPMPGLPVAPLALRRSWRLPPRLTPLHPGRYQLLPGSAAAHELAALPHRFGDLFHLPGSWARLDPLVEDRSAGAREALERAVQELRGRHADRTLALGEVVHEIAFNYLKDRYALLIDTLALRKAGVGPETPLSFKRLASNEAAPPWTECGLRAVPARSAILLTTASGRGAALREPFTEEMEQALAEAARRGQDASGRFCSPLNWRPLEGIAAPPSEPPPPFDFENEGGEWSEWEPVAGLAEDRLIVVRREGVTTAGLTFSLFLGLLLWLLWRLSIRHRLTLLLAALALCGLGVLWLPASLRDLAWWPLLAGCVVTALWYVRAVARRTGRPKAPLRVPKGTVPAAAIVGFLALSLFGWRGRAADPAPATVYLVPGTAEAADATTVLAPAELLDRLKALARPAPLAALGPRTVLLDAFYEGQLVEGQAEFSAAFSAHSLTDEPSTLTLPLAGMQLTGDVLLDGASVAPLALPAPQAGYTLPVRGRGRHKVALRFRAPVVGTTEDRNVLFTVPPLPRSRLSWRLPPGAAAPQMLVKYGAQWTTRDGGGERLEADLGALPASLHLHWYQPGASPRLRYQAAYFWDLGVDANRLRAWLHYRVEQGAVQTLQVDLPAELEVSSATAQRTLSPAPPSWRTRFQLRDLYVTRAGGKRTLHLELPYPISGDFQATLELLPRSPLSSPAALPVPAPVGVPAGGPHYLAYRTKQGLSAQRDTTKFLTRIGANEFAPAWPGVPRLDAAFAGIAYQITPHQAPQLRLRLEQTPAEVQAEVEVTVQAGTHRAELQASAEMQMPNKDVAAIVWQLPAPRCTIVSVAGEDVRTWKQNGSRLLVWLHRTTTATRMQLTGWLPVERPNGRSTLQLNGLHLHPAGKQHTRLRLLANSDLSLASVEPRRLQPASSPVSLRRSSAQEQVFETSDSFYGLRCAVQAAANASARVLTLAEAADRELRFTTTVDYTITHGELRYVRLRLRNWEREKVEVQAERVALWPSPRRTTGERSWVLPLQPGVTGRYQVTLRGSLSLEDAALGVQMPEVLVQGVEHAEYFLAVPGGDLTAQARGSLQPLQAPRSELQSSWPGAAQRLERTGGQAWRVRDAEWQVRLLPHARALEPDPIRVFLMEQSAAVVDGRRWLHEARCWLRHEAHADLHIDFPAPARVIAAAVDGSEVTPLQPSSARVWLPLPGRPGVRRIRLRWLYDPPEPLDRPQLTPPQLADATAFPRSAWEGGPTLWTVMVPAGWRAQAARGGPSAERLGSGPTREAALALARAEAQFHISQDLAKQRRDRLAAASLASAQQRFALFCRRCRQAIDLGADGGGVRGPNGHSLADALEELQAKNRALATQSGFETVPLDGEGGRDAGPEGKGPLAAEDDSIVRFTSLDVAAAGAMPQRGMPMSWQSPPGAEPLTLRLTSSASEQTRQALADSGQWLGVLVVVWILSLVPFWPALARRFWPEQIALLGLLGWHLAGLTSIVVSLLLIAACGRMVLLVRALRALPRKRRQQPSTMNAGSGVLG